MNVNSTAGGAFNFATSRRGDRKRKDDHSAESNGGGSRTTQRSRCADPAVGQEDLIMMGLYRLDEHQERIYRDFVSMVSGFDDFDKVNAMELALE